jgi:predicted HNH restriction endonuclease
MGRENDTTWVIIRAFFCGKCEHCGTIAPEKRPEGKYWVIHHIDGNQINNRLENLAFLCARCHARIHRTKADLRAMGFFNKYQFRGKLRE